VVGLSIIFGLSYDALPGLYAGVDPMLRPMFSSSLAVATICAVLLNVFFRLGISQKMEFEIDPSVDTSEKIFQIMEKQGGIWGARRDIIMNCIAAMNELLDAAPFLELMGKKIYMSVRFDEFNLDVRTVYEGKPFEIPAAMPSIDFMHDEKASALSLAAFTMSRYVDKMSFAEMDGKTELHMHFEH
jgi:NCS2 family nucleobase:cation symporter-2